jgi:HAE1 family hydrophobic/amphiphilic exporter-1
MIEGEYPEIAPPTVQVSATYTGANAETMLKQCSDSR